MIHVFFYKAIGLHPHFDAYLLQLPVALQKQILRFRSRRDAQRSLFGKLLLVKGLEFLGLNKYRLSDLSYTSYQRPYFDHTFDFNIAHSGEYIACAISKTSKVGIDIEEVKPTVLDDFRLQFTEAEWQKVVTSEDSLHAFYRLWTQKEATIKALGDGLSIPLKQIHISNGKAQWNNQELYLFELELGHTHLSFLATDTIAPEIVIHPVLFDKIPE
ncbi:MAG: 4'-phosphopantetheinyl transferase superfamily protein [Hymenobacteraceae bacterium]|nr:4'-phosphopantetheinyl transferase superfamily protein [Hymenobacteraceae bacterium]MDX5421138.1 4'-phosphopantetheinyl transferase superfamily protein [Hymenobacteraceae bacterium]